jgi:hypothetical protein
MNYTWLYANWDSISLAQRIGRICFYLFLLTDVIVIVRKIASGESMYWIYLGIFAIALFRGFQDRKKWIKEHASKA